MTNTEWDTLPDIVQKFLTALDAREVDQVLAPPWVGERGFDSEMQDDETGSGSNA
ncbi:hypothetical protein PDG61_06845 [Mycolicibacterium sp. BiH015]|uniref:hypothetical protein n=1 Tax=Mycolicibacterium sp. BiH015 TaxID=3018808 RepID=UPI0022E44F10|nr:hypothetical protein [Mycolicibacterium sp. BiH015]MDA2890621.1 hypothetical protein [Mycolicibacterium sp. BiH015]